jgi:hypothetical protein
LDSTQAPTVWCHYALTNEIAAAIVVVATIAIRITVSADPQTKTASAKSAAVEAAASVAASVTASVMTASSERYGRRN